MRETQVLSIDKIIEIILGLALIIKGDLAFGITLLTFGLITINFRF